MNSLRVAWFLAYRQIKRSSVWSTLLIIVIMTLTFLNLVVVGGILVGLTTGSVIAYNKQYAGDVLVRALPSKDYIEQSQEIIKTARSLPGVVALSPRFLAGGSIETNYKQAVGPKDTPDKLSVVVAGIDPQEEESTTGMGFRLLEGEYLHPHEERYVLLGKNLLQKYSAGVSSDAGTVLDLETGSRLRLTVAGNTDEYTVHGVVSGKIAQVSGRVFMLDTELRRLVGRTDNNVGEIAIRVAPGVSPVTVRDGLKGSGFQTLSRIETARESQGSFIDDIEMTFRLLSDVIGGIGLIVASITVFIVIFINAVTRRKFIGILKGIGISDSAVEISYMLQSLFYAVIGSGIGLLLVYGFLKSYIDVNPINFPFSDGVLDVPVFATFLRAGVLLLVTVIAGYIPSRMIVKRNTLDSILGR